MGVVLGRPRSGVPGRYQGNQRRRVVGRLWPHGAFSIGMAALGEDAEVGAEVHEAAVAEVEGVFEWCQLEVLDPSKGLTLPNPPNSHIEPARPDTYGRKGITRFGANMVKAGAFIIEEQVQQGNVSFLTLTLPPLEASTGRLIASQWGKVINRLIQWLRRELERAGVRRWVVLASELQPKRASKGDPCCLHVHAMFQGRLSKRHDWAVKKARVKAAWESILSNVCGEQVTSKYYPYIRPVKYSAAGYIGKYMSKGVSGLTEFVEMNGWECVPRQWWSVTQDLRREITRRTMHGQRTGEALEAVVSAYFAGDDNGFPGFLQAIHAVVDGHAVLVGYSGALNREVADELREWLTCTIGPSP